MNNLGGEPLPTLAVTVTRPGDARLVVVVRGEVDLGTAPQLRAVLMEAITVHETRQVTIDAAAMTFLDAAGMGALVAVYQYAAVHRIQVRMENVQPSVMVPLRIVNLVEFLQVAERRGL